MSKRAVTTPNPGMKPFPDTSPMKITKTGAFIPLSPGPEKAKLHMEVVSSLLGLSSGKLKKNPVAQQQLHQQQHRQPVVQEVVGQWTLDVNCPIVKSADFSSSPFRDILRASKRLAPAETYSRTIQLPRVVFERLFGKIGPSVAGTDNSANLVTTALIEPSSSGTLLALPAETSDGGATFSLRAGPLLNALQASSGDVLVLRPAAPAASEEEDPQGAPTNRALASIENPLSTDPSKTTTTKEAPSPRSLLTDTDVGDLSTPALGFKAEGGGGGGGIEFLLTEKSVAGRAATISITTTTSEDDDADEDMMCGPATASNADGCGQEDVLSDGHGSGGGSPSGPVGLAAAGSERITSKRSHGGGQIHAAGCEGKDEEGDEGKRKMKDNDNEDPDWHAGRRGGAGAGGATIRTRGRPRKRKIMFSSSAGSDANVTVSGRGAAGGGLMCSHCGTHETPRWWKDTFPMGTLCNACGIWLKRHGYPRPVQFFAAAAAAAAAAASATPPASANANAAGTPPPGEFYLINGRPKRRRVVGAVAHGTASGHAVPAAAHHYDHEHSADPPPINFDAAGSRVFVVRRKLIMGDASTGIVTSALVHFGWAPAARAAHEMYDRVVSYCHPTCEMAVEDFELLADTRATAMLVLKPGNGDGGPEDWDAVVRDFVSTL